MTTTGQDTSDSTREPTPGSTPSRDEEAVARFVEDFAVVMVDAGMPRMPARVMACLMAADGGALTAAELSRRLSISPAAVSGAIRYLADLRLVSRGREPGTTRDLYRVQQNVWYQSFAARDQLFGGWLDTMRRGTEAVGPDTEAGQRLSESAEFLQFMLDELNGMMQRWEARQAELRRSP